MLNQLLLGSLITFSTITARIFESPSIKSLQNHISDKNCLIIFDLDNTLIEPISELGSDQWFYAAVKHATNKGMKSSKVYETLLPYYFDLHNSLHYKATDKRIPGFINRLHKHNYKVVGLTARSPQLLDNTLRQLDESKIDLSNSWKDYDFQKYDGLHHEAHFKHGVILCGRNPKGDILKSFLKHNELSPSKIIFVDDKEYNLTAVQEAAKDLEIPFTGIRYNGLDKKIQNFKLNPKTLP